MIASVRHSFADAFFPRLSEWYTAGVLMALGVMLSSNPDLMASSKTSAYELMLLIANQDTWAWIMKGFAFFRLTVLFINGSWRRSPHLRSATAFLSLFFWTQITLSFAPIFGYAFVFACGHLVLDLANSIRAARDARIIDHAYGKGGTAGGQE
jgi:hypothetical protein